MIEMTEHEQITRLLENLGAARAQAQTMASQIQKRCDQWVIERGIDREEAMAALLEKIVKGRKGETP